MRILVTGGCGFIGSNFIKYILTKEKKEDIFITNLDKQTYAGQGRNLEHMGLDNHPRYEFVKGDIRETNTLKDVTQDIEAVVHLAAIVGDPACAQQPGLARQINLNASINLFDICLVSNSVRRFIFASTCSNYGRMQGTDYID